VAQSKKKRPKDGKGVSRPKIKFGGQKINLINSGGN
jgi:hypothetical protein